MEGFAGVWSFARVGDLAVCQFVVFLYHWRFVVIRTKTEGPRFEEDMVPVVLCLSLVFDEISVEGGTSVTVVTFEDMK